MLEDRHLTRPGEPRGAGQTRLAGLNPQAVELSQHPKWSNRQGARQSGGPATRRRSRRNGGALPAVADLRRAAGSARRSMVASWRSKLLLAAVCMAQLALVAQATRAGPMLRGGTVVLLSGPRSGFVMPRPLPGAEFPGAELDHLDRFDEGTLDRVLAGPSVFGAPLRMFGRPEGLLEAFGPPRRPCSFGHRGAGEPDAIVKHMAAARFGPRLLSSLLAAAEAEEQQQAVLDAPVYTINPVTHVRASVEPRRLGGVDFDKAGPFGNGPFRGRASQPRRGEAQHGEQAEQAPVGWDAQQGGWDSHRVATALSAGFGVSEAGAARLTPEAVEALKRRYGVDVSLDRMQLGASRSFPMVTIRSKDGGDVDAASAEVHAITDDSTSFASSRFSGFGQAAHRVLPAKAAAARAGCKWRFRDFVSRIGSQGAQPAAAFPQPDARQRATFGGRLFGDRGASLLLRPAHTTQPPPALTWDLFQEDGQLNSGVLVFLLLCAACVAVWSRLLVLWCTFRHGAGRRGRRCRRRGRRFGAPAAAKGRDAVEDSLEAPLLNPLHHEAPLPNVEPFKVEVSAKHTPEAPMNNFVTLEYVPLKGEQ